MYILVLSRNGAWAYVFRVWIFWNLFLSLSGLCVWVTNMQKYGRVAPLFSLLKGLPEHSSAWIRHQSHTRFLVCGWTFLSLINHCRQYCHVHSYLHLLELMSTPEKGICWAGSYGLPNIYYTAPQRQWLLKHVWFPCITPLSLLRGMCVHTQLRIVPKKEQCKCSCLHVEIYSTGIASWQQKTAIWSLPS